MLMRGGTSKGAYFVASDLPTETTSRDELLMAVMGTPDPRQIDGIGGAHPLTSKVAIVSASSGASGVTEPMLTTFFYKSVSSVPSSLTSRTAETFSPASGPSLLNAGWSRSQVTVPRCASEC
jgi:hypothetical protein